MDFVLCGEVIGLLNRRNPRLLTGRGVMTKDLVARKKRHLLDGISEVGQIQCDVQQHSNLLLICGGHSAGGNQNWNEITFMRQINNRTSGSLHPAPLLLDAVRGPKGRMVAGYCQPVTLTTRRVILGNSRGDSEVDAVGW